ncbi:unnamed protein product [Triticum aestivum]|uniref:Nucleotide-diphospho-sugar transferase domain-containing protein n=5 Tax=Triticinae TaxID=1648030 RepID=A0A9R1EP09_WHEAT|nr:uncharacterized protein At4g15970 isoform X1 [Aegilops tauschii subsp. strangulata]XP_044329857.1 uncharacterized protein At4g15970-like isoform X1 [Triticum aestivum]KAF7013232.1 hypothetical protein CFC21_027332 [Triticum aestivum]SPT15738.1 unnamed protein product [Triticum aestivum]
MKSATSLLLGAALATACFLLYTSVGRDLGARTPPAPRWAPEKGAGGADRPKQEVVVKVEEVTKGVVASSDGGGRDGSSPEQEKQQRQQQIVMPVNKQQQQDKPQDLADLLRRAANADRTVLMTALNEAWAAPGSFLDLFLESFKHGENTAHLVQHLLIVAMDKKAFDRCNAVHPFCYWFRVEGMDFAAEQKYMKGDYLEMMWKRNRFQQTILELGYTFLFTDVDILWFRDPFPRMSPAAQVVMSSDFFVGDPDSPGNYPNGGLLYVRSCAGSIGFYEHWQASRARFPGMHEQYVFDKIVKEGVPGRLGTRVQFLDTGRFGGFCQHGKDLGRIVTMHANCCVGLENKLFDLKNVLEDWKIYKKRVAAGNTDYFSWRVPGRCIH